MDLVRLLGQPYRLCGTTWAAAYRYIVAVPALCFCTGCQPARPITWIEPRYPMMLVSANYEGQVVAHIPVSRTGAVGAIRIDSTARYHAGFAFAVRNALRSATFAPATHFGRPVDGEVTLPVAFVLLRPVTPLANDERTSHLDSLPERCPNPADAFALVVCRRSERPRFQTSY